MKSPYFGLWSLLVCALIVVALIAFLDSDISIGSLSLKKAPIPATLGFVESHTETHEIDADSDSLNSAEPEVNKVDSTSQSILLFGDSMTMNLAFRLAQYAKTNGHTFHAVNWDASNTKLWAESDTLEFFIDKFRPTYFFISLGSNEMFFKDPSVRLPFVRRIISKLHGAPYVWIGPPDKNKGGALTKMLEDNLVPGAFFNSDGMNFKRQSDNIHPTRKASATWIDTVMRWIPNSANPILLNRPDDSIGYVNPQLVILKADKR